jgi:hypothetical protein
MDTAALIRDAETAMDGKDPEYGWPINNGFERAVPYLLLALVREQQAIGTQLAGLDVTLSRIASALEQRNAEPALAPTAEPKRRWWQPGR